LSGFVDSEQQRQRATALAQSVPGVKVVTNTIEVK
jgi:osmotically-inducible protein OsmY